MRVYSSVIVVYQSYPVHVESDALMDPGNSVNKLALLPVRNYMLHMKDQVSALASFFSLQLCVFNVSIVHLICINIRLTHIVLNVFYNHVYITKRATGIFIPLINGSLHNKHSIIVNMCDSDYG